MGHETEMRPDLLVKFVERVDRSGGPDACWEWTAGKNAYGYGECWTGNTPERRGHVVTAHRVAYTLWVGPIPDGLTLDHLCRNKACVNPAHLEPCTHRTNILRSQGQSALNAVKTHCPKGHPYDEANTYLTSRGTRACRECNAARGRGPNYSGPRIRDDLDIREIVELRESNLSWREIAERVGASQWTCRQRYGSVSENMGSAELG